MSDGNELDGTLQDLKAFESGIKSATGAIGEFTRSAKNSSGGVGGTKTGTIMDGALGNVSMFPRTGGEQAPGGGMGGGIRGNFLTGLAGFSAGVGIAAAQTYFDGMPDVQKTVDRATQYYNAGIYGGNQNKLRSATFSAMQGGITSLGSDARVAEYLQSRGMTQSKSNYLGTVSAVSNAAKYLNMSNERSAVALEGLTSGKTSSDLLRNLGIYTSDPRTGQAYSQSQIFSAVAGRLTAGQSKATVDQVNESFRRGKLGASLSGLGLSEDQQNMMHMYMVARAQGVTLDLTNQKQMDAFAKQNGLNPASSGYQINTYDTQAMDKAQNNYLEGIKAALPQIKFLSDEAGKAADGIAGWTKAFKAALESSQAGKAAVSGAENVINQLVTGLGTLLGGLGLGKMLGGGPKGVPGLPKGPGALTKLAPFLSEMGPVGVAAGTAVAATAATLGANSLAADAIAKNNNMTSSQRDAVQNQINFSSFLGAGANGGNFLSAGVGSRDAQNLISPRNSSQKTDLFKPLSDWWNGVFGGGKSGGTNSTINAQGPTGNGQQNTVKFTWPAGNASLVSDGFGPRTPPTPGASSYHQGIDISVGMGTPIMASADGEVVQSGNNGGYGNCVQIKHANGYVTLYGHQSRIATSMGKKVVQGQVIGYVGSTGTSTGAHLHFGVKDASGNFIDPMKVLGGTATATYGSQSSASGSSGSSAPASDMAGISDSRAKAGVMTVSSYRGAEIGGAGAGSGFKAMAMGSNAQTKDTMNLGVGISGKNNLTSSSMGIYLPGARRAKTGDAYVANDGPVNVHSGEAILTSEQAEVWRTMLKQGGLGKGNGNNVTINLSIAQASESEAKRFASIVKDMLEKDTLIQNMGRR